MSWQLPTEDLVYWNSMSKSVDEDCKIIDDPKSGGFNLDFPSGIIKFLEKFQKREEDNEPLTDNEIYQTTDSDGTMKHFGQQIL